MKTNKLLKTYFLLAAFLIGLIHAWIFRDSMESDGISYLDMGDAVACGEWRSLINGTWSPLYAIIIGFFFYIFKVDPSYELIIVHSVNFFIYLIALFCFHYFLNQLIRDHKQAKGTLSEWILITLGYTLFTWSSMNFISLSRITPDLLVAAVVYLVSGILLQIKLSKGKLWLFILLGIILGVGYLSKEVMFVISFIYLGASIFAVKESNRRISYVLLGVISFLLVISPYVFLLSKAKGHLTFGETGKQNYHWFANENVCSCFQTGFPGCNGKLIHPIREIFSNPIVFEYSTPFFNATYPPMYDPSYWCEGANPYFDLKGQIIAILKSAKEYFDLFFNQQQILLVAYLVLLFISSKKSLILSGIKEKWILILPPILVMLMYSLVHVESRYISSFNVILWLGLFTALKSPDVREIKTITSALTIVVASFLTITSIFSSDLLINPPIPLRETSNKQIANELKRININEGDKAGIVNSCEEDIYWARLARVRIVVEIPGDEETNKFWTSNEIIKSKVYDSFRKAGAKIILADKAPAYASKWGWKNIKDTPYYFYVL